MFYRERVQWYSLGIFLILLCGITFSIFGFISLRQDENDRIHNAFFREMDNRYASLDRELDLHKEFLFGMKGLFDASDFVSRTEFKTYVEPASKRIGGLQAVEWIPYVPKKLRSAFENKVRDDGYPDFVFTYREKQKQMVSDIERDEYYPVYYVDPLKGNEAAFGFNLGSSPARLQTLIQARDTGSALITPRITLVQEKGSQGGILQFVPVYERPSKTVTARRNNLKGFVLGVHRLGDIMLGSLKKIGSQGGGIDYCLVDASVSGGEELFQSGDWTLASKSNPFYYEKELPIGGRTWKYLAVPTDEFVAQHITYRPYSFLGAGIIISVLLAAYLRQRANELKDTRSVTQAIIDASLHSMIMIDSDGTVLLFNPAAEQTFGYSSTEVIGKNVTMLMPEPFKSNHPQFLKNYLTTGRKKIIGIGREVVGQKKNGTVFPIYLSVSEMERASGAQRFLGVIMDITRQKNDEIALINAKEIAESANQTKSDFLNVMSHELRTPLTVILGYLPILMDEAKIPEDKIIVQIAGEMNRSGKHLLTLINDLLDISKIEAGGLNLDLQPVFVPDSLAEMIEMFHGKVEDGGVTFTTHSGDIVVLADPIRLRQILINLVGNAIKFTDKGNISISVEPRENEAVFSVKDTGEGIAKADIDLVFDVFRQVDSSSSRAAEGTGLGLAITQRLVEMHGGVISVESVQGEGSIFTFTIPLAGKKEVS